jgi:hypothetical protein
MASALELLMLAQLSVNTRQYVPSGGITVSTTGFTTTVFTWNVAISQPYKMKAEIGYVANQSAGTPSLEIGASGATTSFCGYEFKYLGGGVTPGCTWKTGLGLGLGGPAMTSGDVYLLTIDGTIEFSSAGTITLLADTTSASDTWTIQQGSYMDLIPI